MRGSREVRGRSEVQVLRKILSIGVGTTTKRACLVEQAVDDDIIMLPSIFQRPRFTPAIFSKITENLLGQSGIIKHR